MFPFNNFRLENAPRVDPHAFVAPAAPEPLKRVAPIYPPVAFEMGREGKVAIAVGVDEGVPIVVVDVVIVAVM